MEQPPTGPLALALDALNLAYERHLEARETKSLLRAWSSAAESVWWICAIDEQLEQAPAYKPARDADADGQYVSGLRWLRDRHSHQLPITSSLDQTPFLGSGRGIIYISPGFFWRPVDEIADPFNKHPERRKAYARLIAERKTTGALSVARRWLTSAVAEYGSDAGTPF